MVKQKTKMTQMKRTFRFLRRFQLIFLALILGGYAFISYSFVDNYFEISKNLDIFTTLFRELDIYYVDPIQPGKLMKTGIDAMLASLDPYTDYIPESQIEDYRFMTTGEYGGIGAVIRREGKRIMIAQPYKGFPADKAGLMAGDIILKVDGIPVTGKSSNDMSKLLKGQPDTPVKLLIQRDSTKAPFEKTLMREEIKVKSVPYHGMLTKHIGYIRLNEFTEDAGKEVKNALLDLKKDPDFNYLVLDLRDNPGGLLREAVDIVNLFEPKGQVVVKTRGKVKEWDSTHRTLNDPVDLKIPIAILVNSGTASAAEIVSGTLQDLDRAVVIGQRTFGKGLVQQTRPLSYNAQLKVTVAKYYIPSGRCIQALDYSHRNPDGSVDRVPDSLITAFRTKDGRIVYDGGGIMPDVKMKESVYSNIAVSLLSKSLIFNYATKYRRTHDSIADLKDYVFSDKDYQNFVSYLKGKDYDYTTKSEEYLSDLKESTEKEKYYDAIKPEFKALKNKIMHDKKKDLVKNKEEIKELLAEEIAARYYYQAGRLEEELKTDPGALKAESVLRDSTEYDSILTTIGTPTRPFHDPAMKNFKPGSAN